MLIVADDLVVVEADLVARRLLCPRCGVGGLAGWGFARPRVLRVRGGERWLSPRRGRCRGCDATHVLLPDVCLVRRRDAVEVIGEALTCAVREGCRPIAARLGVPMETVRGWVRRARARAAVIAAHFLGWVRALDRSLAAPGPAGCALADALEAIGLCARAASLALGFRPAWSWVSALSAGGLLCNTSSLSTAPG